MAPGSVPKRTAHGTDRGAPDEWADGPEIGPFGTSRAKQHCQVTTAGSRSRAVQGRLTMDSDRVEGTIKEGTGKVQEEWGDATNDPRAEEEGLERQAEGDLQQKWGEAKDAARDVADEVDEKV
jgi:uncharacterized protein YjbJ (UPF0337 family)